MLFRSHGYELGAAGDVQHHFLPLRLAGGQFQQLVLHAVKVLCIADVAKLNLAAALEQHLAQVLGFLPHLGRDNKNDASGLERSIQRGQQIGGSLIGDEADLGFHGRVLS